MPTIAPVAAGAIAHYFSWRLVQHALGIMGLIGLVPIFFWVPETLDPDLLRTKQKGGEKQLGWVWLNPFSGLSLLRSPNIVIVVSTTVYFRDAVYASCLLVLRLPLWYRPLVLLA